jgi:hypothetical protein
MTVLPRAPSAVDTAKTPARRAAQRPRPAQVASDGEPGTQAPCRCATWSSRRLELVRLDCLTEYGKPLWVTEMAKWHTGDGDAAIAKQEAQMADMVNTSETRAALIRYAWFTGRQASDPHYTSLMGANAGELTGLGQSYLTLPFTPA